MDIEYIRRHPNDESKADEIEEENDPETLRAAIEQRADVPYNGQGSAGGIGEYTEVQRAFLKNEVVRQEDKFTICRRNDPDYINPDSIRVPSEVVEDARTVLNTGKPLVLYGPTGTGKTVLAQQLAREIALDYILATATPNWDSKDIIGGIDATPNNQGTRMMYKRTPGHVSRAALNAMEFKQDYAVILDEITRAEISKVFGGLYTAIENPRQTIFTTESGTSIQLEQNEDVHIIATMNSSDRTVNELDDAITRRFGMVKIDKYPPEHRAELFGDWTDANGLDDEPFITLFQRDLEGLNGEGADDPITRFGPMHYKDILDFVAEGTSERGSYESTAAALDAGYRNYIIPRLLNTATLNETEQLLRHYKSLPSEVSHITTDLTLDRSLELLKEAKQRRETEIGRYE